MFSHVLNVIIFELHLCNVQNPVVAATAGAVGKGCAKAVMPKVTVKPKPEEIIEVSANKDEELRHANQNNFQKTSSRKKVHPLSSVLAAQSKVMVIIFSNH